MEMLRATRAARIALARELRAIQPTSPMSMIESPMVFRMSTRRRSVHGDHGLPKIYS